MGLGLRWFWHIVQLILPTFSIAITVLVNPILGWGISVVLEILVFLAIVKILADHIQQGLDNYTGEAINACFTYRPLYAISTFINSIIACVYLYRLHSTLCIVTVTTIVFGLLFWVEYNINKVKLNKYDYTFYIYLQHKLVFHVCRHIINRIHIKTLLNIVRILLIALNYTFFFMQIDIIDLSHIEKAVIISILLEAVITGRFKYRERKEKRKKEQLEYTKAFANDLDRYIIQNLKDVHGFGGTKIDDNLQNDGILIIFVYFTEEIKSQGDLTKAHFMYTHDIFSEVTTETMKEELRLMEARFLERFPNPKETKYFLASPHISSIECKYTLDYLERVMSEIKQFGNNSAYDYKILLKIPDEIVVYTQDPSIALQQFITSKYPQDLIKLEYKETTLKKPYGHTGPHSKHWWRPYMFRSKLYGGWEDCEENKEVYGQF